MQNTQKDAMVLATVPLTKATWIKPEIESLDLGFTDGKPSPFFAESSVTTGPS
ncbi:hypothetical protein [Shewanella sp.]|uniref:hypothetical protein n=1 Tax=Shewanella sp. TaxID=50422 RepID=UPI0040489658